MLTVFEDDGLGRDATILIQSATSEGTDQNYSSKISSFFKFCDASLIAPLDVSPIDITRYVTWIGRRRTVAAANIQPYH